VRKTLRAKIGATFSKFRFKKSDAFLVSKIEVKNCVSFFAEFGKFFSNFSPKK